MKQNTFPGLMRVGRSLRILRDEALRSKSMSATFRHVLDALYQDCLGFVELRALPSKHQFFSAADGVDAMRQFVQAHKGEDLYFAVATRTSHDSGTAENTLHLPALFGDLDFKTISESDARSRLANCPIQPSIVIHSGGGLHCYWPLREPIDLTVPTERAMAVSLLNRLTAFSGR